MAESMELEKWPILSLLKSGVLIAACFGLAACSFGRTAPADIKPVYRVLNSPLPVPGPRWNPRRQYASASVNTRVRTTGNSQTRKPAVRPTATVASTPVSGAVVIVARGDTLYSLARKNNVPVRSMIAANNLRAPYTLAIGQKLKLPLALQHVVVKGETGYGISRRYGVNITALMRENGIRKPYTLSVGQRLTLPGGAKPAARQVASAGRREAPKGRVVALPSPPARSRSGFSWPIDGKLASRFGPKEGGLHNDGINILAKQGTPVRSAETGVVVYASNALEGYGNLLLLKHADGWLTAYAHNERLLVNKGDKIGKGQIIARVGATGGVSDPQLHFEIRKGRRALDPLDYLKSQVASAR